MRGEHCSEHCFLYLPLGSSPHARGTRGPSTATYGWSGIIPACAGNTMSRHFYAIDWGDHPRMRGEHVVITSANSALLGSSPHARGTPYAPAVYMGCTGIIPACAGNTEFLTSLTDGRMDHPRMRGEHMRLCQSWGNATGSSPHARGTQLADLGK